MLLLSGVQASHSPPVRSSGLQLAKGACLACSQHQGWGTQYVAETTHSPGRVSICVISPFLWVLSQGHGSWPDHFFFFPTWFHVELSCSLGCEGIFWPVSSYFSVEIVLHVDVFLMYLWGEVISTSPTWSILTALPTVFVFENKWEKF